MSQESTLAACAQRAHAQGKAYLMVGFADEDPLLARRAGYLHVTYRSDVYEFDGRWTRQSTRWTDPVLEVATL